MDSHGDATHLLRGRIGQVDIGSFVGVKGAGGGAGVSYVVPGGEEIMCALPCIFP